MTKDKMSELLNLIINKEIFLGELINNASNALDKIGLESNLDAEFIKLVPQKPNKTLCIIDNGIGMTKADLVDNLGSKVKERLQGGVDVTQIDQLSIGFYSSFLVADKVIVTTKHNNHEQYIWESQAGASSFTVTSDINGEQLERGTKITLFLKDDQLEYLEETRIEDLVKKHSKFITHPIYLWTEKTREHEIGDVKDDDEDKEKDSKKDKMMNESSHEWQLINIWLGMPEETTKDMGATSKKLRNHIPDYLALPILSKLPLKSLKRFGCACKSWAALLENPHFMKKFMSNNHSYYDDTSLLLRRTERLEPVVIPVTYTSSLFSLSGERFQNRVKLDWPNPFKEEGQEDEPAYTILGSSSVNGILCLCYSRDKILLWNPATGDFKVIPPSPVELNEPPNQVTYYCPYGFGYDHVRDDYKVLRQVDYYPECDFWDANESLCEIYSLRSNSWRKLDEYMIFRDVNKCRLYLDGICHWLDKTPDDNDEDEPYLVSFDLSNEVYFTTPNPLVIPSHIYDNFDIRLVYRYLALLNGSITMISNYIDKETFYISMLGQLGVKESWTRVFTVGLTFVKDPIGVGRKGNIFLRKKDDELAFFDLSTHMIEELGVKGKEWWCDIIVYKKSFIPFLEE